jgi:hypothetical protein
VKLFAIYIGGEHPGAHIEAHDVRFVVAESVRETHAKLRADWWGTPGTLAYRLFGRGYAGRWL